MKKQLKKLSFDVQNIVNIRHWKTTSKDLLPLFLVYLKCSLKSLLHMHIQVHRNSKIQLWRNSVWEMPGTRDLTVLCLYVLNVMTSTLLTWKDSWCKTNLWFLWRTMLPVNVIAALPTFIERRNSKVRPHISFVNVVTNNHENTSLVW